MTLKADLWPWICRLRTLKAPISGLVLVSCMSLLSSCVSPSDKTEGGSHQVDSQGKTDHLAAIWFDGTVEQAFAQSKTSGKPVFLYWGAVWCPPCHELKAEVFSKPGFADLMSSFIPVYLDGDQPSAQKWGETLHAAGYPTILILTADRQELARISGGLSFAEFKRAIAGALNQTEDLASFFQRVGEAKSLSERDWVRLAYLSWAQLPAEQFPLTDLWPLQHDLLDRLPKNLAPALRGKLLANYLATTLQVRELAKTPPEIRDQLDELTQKQHFKKLLARIQAKPEATFGARQMLIFQAGDLANWLAHNQSDWVSRYLAVVDRLAENPGLSLDLKLWTVYPHIELARYQANDTDSWQPTPSLKQRVQKAVKRADDQATSNYERHAVISGAAYLLRLVGDWDAARQLLTKELEQTDTPWYYYSSLANLEMQVGNRQKALDYSRLARQTAKGRATKVQWLTSDLLLNLSLLDSNQIEQTLTLIDDYYQMVFQLDDGFLGRNQTRAGRVAGALADYLENDQLRQLLQSYRQRCETLDGDNRQSCQQHFQGLL
jgi:protein disulfide-isomerase